VSDTGQQELRTLAFGDLDAGLWGIAYVPFGVESGTAYVGALEEGGSTRIEELSFELPATEWQMHADGIDVALEPAGEPAQIVVPEHGIQVASQLCHVTGRVTLDGADRQLDCFGQLGTRAWPEDPATLESLREIVVWFGQDEGVDLVSLRPRRSAGHDRDLVHAVLFEEGHAVPVADPRLSSTYTAAGRPSRASLELWLEDPDEDSPDGDDAGPPHFPRRAAGESVGAGVRTAAGGMDVCAELFRWHMGGREGLGFYLLARPS
jgi:hypothetical protein